MPVDFKMWLAALDADQSIPSSTQHTLLRAGLFIGFKSNGIGFFSMERLAGAVSAGYSTVRRHVKWALDNGWLVRVSRGRSTDGAASTYQLHVPLIYASGTGKGGTAHLEPRTAHIEVGTAHPGERPSSSSLSEASAKDKEDQSDDAQAASAGATAAIAEELEMIREALGYGVDEATAFRDSKWSECRNKAKWSKFLAQGIDWAKAKQTTTRRTDGDSYTITF